MRVAIAAVLLACCVSPNLPGANHSTELLFAEHHFDIDVGSSAGSTVTGMLQSTLNRRGQLGDHFFELRADGSGLFTLQNFWNSEQQLFGLLTVSADRAVSEHAVHDLRVELLRGSNQSGITGRGADSLGCMNFSIHAVAPGTKLMDRVKSATDSFVWAEQTFWGGRALTHQQVGSYVGDIQRHAGAFPDLAFYSWSKAQRTQLSQQLSGQWKEATKRIGGLAHAYSRRTTSTQFCNDTEYAVAASGSGDGIGSDEYDDNPEHNGSGSGFMESMDCVDAAALRNAIYTAVIGLAAAVPINFEDVENLSPLEQEKHPVGDGFAQLFAEEINANRQSEFVDALMLAGYLCAEDIYNEVAGHRSTLAWATRDAFSRLTSVLFILSQQQRRISNNQWGDILDVRHTGGVWADASQRKLMR